MASSLIGFYSVKSKQIKRTHVLHYVSKEVPHSIVLLTSLLVWYITYRLECW